MYGDESDDKSDGSNDLDDFIVPDNSSLIHSNSYFSHLLYVYKSSFHLSLFVYLFGVFVIMTNLDSHFQHLTSIQVFCLTLSGKTMLGLCILEEQLVQPVPTRIIWVFSKWQPDYEQARALTLTMKLCDGGPMSCMKACRRMITTC